MRYAACLRDAPVGAFGAGEEGAAAGSGFEEPQLLRALGEVALERHLHQSRYGLRRLGGIHRVPDLVPLACHDRPPLRGLFTSRAKRKPDTAAVVQRSEPSAPAGIASSVENIDTSSGAVASPD